ncbi:hypothetical protein B0H14DRAFT_2574608 [Mycena olivaceomarginata]|nr:hypothetical protein B0H14DRAFT_2574608 [Mycena olivaceomarginata]
MSTGASDASNQTWQDLNGWTLRDGAWQGKFREWPPFKLEDESSTQAALLGSDDRSTPELPDQSTPVAITSKLHPNTLRGEQRPCGPGPPCRGAVLPGPERKRHLHPSLDTTSNYTNTPGAQSLTLNADSDCSALSLPFLRLLEADASPTANSTSPPELSRSSSQATRRASRFGVQCNTFAGTVNGFTAGSSFDIDLEKADRAKGLAIPLTELREDGKRMMEYRSGYYYS